jgi:hypothetical protein
MASSSAGSGDVRCEICHIPRSSEQAGIQPSQCECCGFGSNDWKKLAEADFSIEDEIACMYILKGVHGIVRSNLGDVAKVCALKKVLSKSANNFAKLRIAHALGKGQNKGKNKGKGKNKVVNRASKGKGKNKVVNRASKGKSKVLNRASKSKG